MGYEHKRKTEVVLELLQQIQYLRLDTYIQSRDRFITHYEARAERGRALYLCAGGARRQTREDSY